VYTVKGTEINKWYNNSKRNIVAYFRAYSRV